MIVMRGIGKAAQRLCAAVVISLGSVSGLAAQQPAKVKVAVPLTGVVQTAALFAAVRDSSFVAEKLDVEIVNFRSWTEPVQAIASDSAQFALGAASLIRAIVGQSAPLRQIAMVSNRFPYDFYVKANSGIKSIADLKGKTIQTVRTGETLDNVWKQVLADAGLTFADVKRIESFNGFGSLVAGSVDVANVDDGLLGQTRKAGLVGILDYTDWRRAHGLNTEAGANLGFGTSLKMLKEQPEVVRGFLRALVKATNHMKQDKEFALAVLQAKPFEVDPDVAGEVYDIHRNFWMVRMDEGKGDASFDAEMVEIVMNLPKGSIGFKSFAAAEPIADVLRDTRATD
jgi:NitT/TauT family transport system substrate-binding protein